MYINSKHKFEFKMNCKIFDCLKIQFDILQPDKTNVILLMSNIDIKDDELAGFGE